MRRIVCLVVLLQLLDILIFQQPNQKTYLQNDYQNLKLIGTQLRAPHSADRISWTTVLYDTQADQIHQATLRENIEITDRTGGGDSFASGVIGAIMEGKGYDEAVEWGAAHGILVQETPGDTTMVSKKMVLSEVARAKKGGGVSALR